MKIHICRTENCPADLAEGVFQILEGVEIKGAGEKMQFTNTIKPLRGIDWLEDHPAFFQKAKDFRSDCGIVRDDFVILLTGTKNARNFFSAFDGERNVYIHTDEWEEFINRPVEYAIAYEVVENVLQTLMGLDLNNRDSTYFHLEPKSCMNDFCERKKQIIHKLVSANICDLCQERISKTQSGEAIMPQALGIFETVRTAFKINLGNVPTLAPLDLIIRNDGISIPGLVIPDLLSGAAQETFFIFLLLHKGIRFDNINTYNKSTAVKETPWNEDFMFALYQRLTTRSDNPVATMLKSSDQFAQYRNAINRKLEEMVPSRFLDNFIIASNANQNKINLDRNLVRIDSPEIINLITTYRRELRRRNLENRIYTNFG
jgi:hypothetical protein